MAILSSLGPLLLALLLGYWVRLPLLNPHRVAQGLSQLTYLILALIGFSIGALDDLTEKLMVAGTQACVFFILTCVLSLGGLYATDRFFHANTAQCSTTPPTAGFSLGWGALNDALKTLAWVIIGGFAGYVFKGMAQHVDIAVTGLLYLLLLLIGCQLRHGNYRLRKLFLNTQGMTIAIVTIATTWLAGWLGALGLGLSWQEGLAVVSGFGWYSLSGILITGLGNPVLGTTAFILDLGREIVALTLIPIMARFSHYMTVGYSGATAMDFTLPMLSRFHGASIVPIAIASGFIMSLFVPIFIPLFLGMH